MRLESKKINQSSLILENIEWNDMNPTTSGSVGVINEDETSIQWVRKYIICNDWNNGWGYNRYSGDQ